MWIARNKNGELKVTNSKPYRKELYGEWFTGREFEGDYLLIADYLLIDSSYFPDLKWEDEPIEVDIISHELKQEYEKIADMYEEEHCKDYTSLSDMCDNNGNIIDMEAFVKKNDK